MTWKSSSMPYIMSQFMNKLLCISLFALHKAKDMPLIIAYNKQTKDKNC